MRYYAKFIPIGERNTEPLEHFDKLHGDVEKEKILLKDIWWRQMADGCFAAAGQKGGDKNERSK